MHQVYKVPSFNRMPSVKINFSAIHEVHKAKPLFNKGTKFISFEASYKHVSYFYIL